MKLRSLLIVMLTAGVPALHAQTGATKALASATAPAKPSSAPKSPPAAAQTPPAGNLQAVLDQMTSASLRFKTATASFRWENYDHAPRETTVQKGMIYFERVGKATEMGASVSYEGASTKPELIEYKGGVLKVYKPEDGNVTVMKAGSNQAKYEGFLTLGFGGSGTDLAANWMIKDMGPEVLKDGARDVKVEKLDLVAKDQASRDMFSHVTIWIDPVRGVSLKQVFFGTDITRTSYFFDIQLNGAVNRGPYKIPANVKVVTP